MKNWLQKIARVKRERDKKHIYLWHASPDRHNVLKPRSRIGKEDYSYYFLTHVGRRSQMTVQQEEAKRRDEMELKNKEKQVGDTSW